MKLFKPYTYLGTKVNAERKPINSINIFLPLPESFTVIDIKTEEVYHKRNFLGLPLKAFMIQLKVDIREELQFEEREFATPPVSIPTYIWSKEFDHDLTGNVDLIVEVDAPEYFPPKQAITPVIIESHANGLQKDGTQYTRIEHDQEARKVPPKKKLTARTIVPIRGADSVIITS